MTYAPEAFSKSWVPFSRLKLRVSRDQSFEDLGPTRILEDLCSFQQVEAADFEVIIR